ncbi:MAG: hypothetical protein JW384_02146 [Nitrosomonadaceae bacterium]|nr:hypothetical protein [Nitrosomonadaceae bacterium]
MQKNKIKTKKTIIKNRISKKRTKRQVTKANTAKDASTNNQSPIGSESDQPSPVKGEHPKTRKAIKRITIKLLEEWGDGPYVEFVKQVLTTGAPTFCDPQVWKAKSPVTKRRTQEPLEPAEQQALDQSIIDDLLEGVLIDITELVSEGKIPKLTPAIIKMIPKKAGGYRRLEDFSAFVKGQRTGVNRWISTDTIPGGCPLADLTGLPSVLHRLKAKYGKVLLSVVDFKSYFKQLRVRKEDWYIYQLEWNNRILANVTLPQGSVSSPHIAAVVSTTVVDASRRHINTEIDPDAHLQVFMDDTLLASGEHSAPAVRETFIDDMESSDLKLSSGTPQLDDPPSEVRRYIGWMIDTNNMTFSLTASRWEKLQQILNEWLQLHPGDRLQRHELQSGCGVLAAMVAVIPAGKVYSHHLHKAANASNRSRMVRWTSAMRAEAQWWQAATSDPQFVAKIKRAPKQSDPHLQIDSSLWGVGATLTWEGQDTEYFYAPWSGEFQSKHMTMLELAGLISTMTALGDRLTGQTVIVEMDNSAVVSMMRKGRARAASLYPMMKSLMLLLVQKDISIFGHWIPSASNDKADYLSRLSAPLEHQASKPSSLPTQLLMQRIRATTPTLRKRLQDGSSHETGAMVWLL